MFVLLTPIIISPIQNPDFEFFQDQHVGQGYLALVLILFYLFVKTIKQINWKLLSLQHHILVDM